MSCLDKPEVGTALRDIGKDQMPANIDLFMNNFRVTSKSRILPIAGINHGYTSGITGSGKSCTRWILIEEAAQKALKNRHGRLGVILGAGGGKTWKTAYYYGQFWTDWGYQQMCDTKGRIDMVSPIGFATGKTISIF